MLPSHSLRRHRVVTSDAQREPVVRVAVAEPSVYGNASAPGAAGLSGGVTAGIVVGSVLGGVVLIVLMGLLIRCLCHRRKVSSEQTKPGTSSSETKAASSSSLWECFRRRSVTSSRRRKVPVPIFGSDKLDPDEYVSDTSFVLPELGGPNPHNKFDGMEWVDIKGLDDDHLQDISTDLRKYQQGQRR